MLVVFGTLGNPSFETSDFRSRKRFTAFGRGHALVRVGSANSTCEFTRSQISWHNRLFARAQFGDCRLALVKPSPGFARPCIGSVAVETTIGKERANVAVKVDTIGGKEPVRAT